VRIGVVCSNREVVGGTETYLRWLLPALAARGHEVAAAFEREALSAQRALDRDMAGGERWTLPELGLARFKARLLAFRPAVVYVHGLAAAELEAWLATRFRAVFYAHDFNGACATGTRRHTIPTLGLCERSFGPACLAVNYLRGCGARRPDRLLRSYRAHQDRSRVLQRYGAVAVASRHVRDVYARQGLSAERLRLLPFPTLEWLPAETPPARRPMGGKILFAGRVTALKGLEHAVRAVAFAGRRLSRALTLTVAGEGPELARGLSLATELGVNVQALGWVDGERKRRLFAESDLLLVPSLWPEPFGVVGIEAGALGVPAVAYDVGGISDWLLPSESGELARAFEFESLGEALVRALRDPDHHAELVQGAWQVARRHSPERHMGALESILASLAADERQPLATPH
jgi:glycosyltransferase involved in cell wall biosynthesis